MSVQDQPAGQGDGEAGGEGAVPRTPTPIELMVDVAAVPFTPEVAKDPTVTESGITTVAEPPGTRVYVTPSVEDAAVKRSWTRRTWRYRGRLTAASFTVLTAPPKAVLDWTAIELPPATLTA